MHCTLRKSMLSGFAALTVLATMSASAVEKRDEVSYLRGPYNIEFFKRHNEAFRISAGIHFAHGKAHDVAHLTPAAERAMADTKFDDESMAYVTRKKPRTEPTMELFGPYTAQFAWDLYRAIDWTHMHHEQTYDILSDKSIPWDKKAEWTERAVQYYLSQHDIPRSPAPLDVTMRRAGVMMKPYFSLFRNQFPRSNNFFYAAHWWHPVIYEAQMLGGNGIDQERMVQETDQTFYKEVLPVESRPQRMLLSREAMPRYSRMSPESANIFDNLHMLHGIAYDILTYEGWTPTEKRAEIYRVVKAMSYTPGDEILARKFSTPRPNMDPRVYEPWMRGAEGEMNRIMMEMMEEMMPMMAPHGMSDDMRQKMMAQFQMKLAPGMQEGEIPGSLADALMKMMPDMKMDKEGMKPGNTPQMMVEAMMAGWRKKYASMPDIESAPMKEKIVSMPKPVSTKGAGQ